MIEIAAHSGANAIFFPELSLTSYEPKLANKLAVEERAILFKPFQAISSKLQITIGLGMPIKCDRGITISMMIFQPHQKWQTYAKQLLHPDESPYFAPGTEQILIEINEHIVFPAICFESIQKEHALKAVEHGADIYLASVAKSKEGLESAMYFYSRFAKDHSMLVVMCNSIGPCDDFISAGKTSIWNRQGELIGQMDGESEGLLIADIFTEQVVHQKL